MTAETDIAEPDPKYIANFGKLEPWLVPGDQPETVKVTKWLARYSARWKDGPRPVRARNYADGRLLRVLWETGNVCKIGAVSPGGK